MQVFVFFAGAILKTSSKFPNCQIIYQFVTVFLRLCRRLLEMTVVIKAKAAAAGRPVTSLDDGRTCCCRGSTTKLRFANERRHDPEIFAVDPAFCRHERQVDRS